MATFLFLVSIAATTLLFIAIAAEEIARVTRRFFARGRAEQASALPVRVVSSAQAGAPSRAAVQPRAAASASNDWIPDQAA